MRTGRTMHTLGAIGLTGAIGALSMADFTSASFRAAGFQAADGEVRGVALSASQKTVVTQAINLLDNNNSSTTQACVDCLRTLLANDRICLEAGTTTAGATTLADEKAGCNPRTEGIHISPGMFHQRTEVIACVLAHEWFHINQSAADYQGNFEAPAYQHEIDCLVALGLTGSNRHMQMVNCLAALNQPPQSPPFDAGRTSEGGKIAFDDSGWSYSMGSDFPGFYISAPDNVMMYGHLVDTPVPYDFEVYTADDKKFVTISGYDPVASSGVIVSYEVVADGQSFFLHHAQTLTDSEPFSLTRSTDGSRLFALDTRWDRVVTFTRDADGAYTVPGADYAGFDDYPALGGALGISANTADARRGMAGDSLIIDYHDTRAQSAVVVDRPRAVLFDDNGDGAADRQETLDTDGTPIDWYDFIAVVPGFVDEPVFGDTGVTVFAGAGAAIEIQAVDSGGAFIETLGAGTMPTDDNEAPFALSRALNPCEYIQAVDTDNIAAVPPRPWYIPNPVDYAEPFGALDFSDVFAFLVAFGAQEAPADLADPEGVFDFSDVFAFLVAFGAGCG